MLSGNFSRSSQDSFAYRQRPVGGQSTICLGEDTASNGKSRYSTSADSYGRVSLESYSDPNFARNKYASYATSNIFTPDYNNPHDSASLSRGSSASYDRASNGSTGSRPIFLQDAQSVDSACMTPRTYRSVDSATSSRPSFLSQPAPVSNMKDVFTYSSSDDSLSHSQRLKQSRRDSARMAAESMAQYYGSMTSADNKRRNVQSNVFVGDAPVAGYRVASGASIDDGLSQSQRPHFKSSVFSNEPLEHKVTRRYEWSDVFGTKEPTMEQNSRRSRARPNQPSQIIFG